MLNYYMKYFVAATVLSYLILTDARPNAFSAKSELAAPTITREAVVVSASILSSQLDPLHSLASAGFAIEVPHKESSDEEGNSPALASIAEEIAEEEEEEEEATESEDIPSSTVLVDENIYAVAGLVYNKVVDLPIYKQRAALTEEDLPPVPQVTACRGVGQIAITYSEGPSDATARIARQLNTAQTRGNFFVNTQWLNQQDYAMVLQKIYSAGHFIGMTYRLPNEDPESMSDEEIKADIINNARMIETLIQVAPKYVRLHFSAQSDGRPEHILRDLGFILVGYNLDGKDYVHKQPELIAEEYSKTFREYRLAHDSKGSFVSIQYDIPETISMTAVPHIIQLIEKEGYNAVRMDACLNDPKPYKASAAGLEYVADKFSFGSASYKSGQKTSIISNTKAEEEEIRGLSADDEFLNTSTSAAVMTLPKKIGFALIPAVVYAIVSHI